MRGKTGDGAVALPQVLDSHDSANEEIFKQCSYARFLARKKLGMALFTRLRMARDIRSSNF